MQSPRNRHHLHLRRNLRLGVGDLDAQLLRTGDDLDSLSGGNVVGDPIAQSCHGSGLSGVLSGVGLVVHQQELDILDVVDDEGLVAGGHHVTGLLVGAEANL
ncbi:hypothetical protein FJTKL_00055 [Diaporthe vaccinii]|uniref:Uncharacterized protein n=1 Tax=Diaporthe vaccinii TaxID=105482 RepID=A0ABR4E4J1_9PEZI